MNERATQKKHHRISHLPNQLEMIHLVIIVRESQPVSPNPNHSKQSSREIFTIASLFLLPLFSASYLQVLSIVELSSAKYLFLLSFGKRSQGDQKHTTSIRYEEFAVLLLLVQTAPPTDKMTIVIRGQKMEEKHTQIQQLNESKVNGIFRFHLRQTSSADIMKRSEGLNYTTGTTEWMAKEATRLLCVIYPI